MLNPDDFVTPADAILREGRLDEAFRMLSEGIKHRPENWKFHEVGDEFDVYHFWNQPDFVAFTDRYRHNVPEEEKKSFFWKTPSYSKAYFLLSYILTEKGDYEGALRMIDEAERLEPDNPKVLTEKSVIFDKLGHEEEALECARKAVRSRPWATVLTRKNAWHNLAIMESNSGNYSEALQAANTALSFDESDQTVRALVGDIIWNLETEAKINFRYGSLPKR